MGSLNPKADDLIRQHPELFEEESLRPRRRRQSAKKKRGGEPVERPRSRRGGGAVLFLTWLGIFLLMVPMALIGGGIGAVAGWLDAAPPIKEFDQYNPPEATIVRDHEGRDLAALYEQQRFVVPLEEIPLDLQNAFIAIEDARFFHHFGVDLPGVARAMTVNLTRGRMSQGASTITQQTARNLLVDIGSEKTLERKFHEMLAALQMEHRYTKERILEVYLNQIYLGSGTYGVEAAARKYFSKSVGELDLAEAASLAGLPQLPERYSPLNNPELTVSRREQVLARMYSLGYISAADYDRAVVEELEVSPQHLARSEAPYFLDAVRRTVADRGDLGGTTLHRAGWTIYTTVDPDTQRIAAEALVRGLEREEAQWLRLRQERFKEARQRPEYGRAPQPGQGRMAMVVNAFESSLVVELPGGWRADVPVPEGAAKYFEMGKTLGTGEGVDLVVTGVEYEKGMFEAELRPENTLQGALVCLDAETGDVRALVGGRRFDDGANNGYFNRAVQAERQAGSTMKPFFYAAAMEAGLTPWTTVHDRPIRFGDGYAPENFENRHFGATTLQTALEHSRNVPTILMVQEVGLRRARQYVRRFQRTSGDPWSLPNEWSVVLGTTEVTPLELAAGYQPLANGGIARGPRLIRGINNEEGRDAIGLWKADEERIVAPQASAYLVQMMAGVMGHGTGRSVREALPDDLRDRVAGKSGTTNENRDAWFAGFTPHEVIVVWVGFDQNMPLGPHRTGSRAAGPIWADFAARLWETKTPQERQAPLRLPEDYVMAPVDPKDSHILDPETEPWLDPPTWRVFTKNDLRSRNARRERLTALQEQPAQPTY